MKVKKTVEVELALCDVCPEDDRTEAVGECSFCGRDACSDHIRYICKKTKQEPLGGEWRGSYIEIYDEEEKICSLCIRDLRVHTKEPE